MLARLSPGQLILIGFAMLVLGVVLPFLMVLRIVEPTLLLGFVAYLASFFGLVIGVTGMLFWGQRRRKDDDSDRP